MTQSRFTLAWDDLRVEPVARTTGANAPKFEKWYDDAAGTSRGVYLYSFDDAATNKCGLLYIDAHYQRDGSGSVTEYIK